MPTALLPRWSSFGDFGPHRDQYEFFGPHLVPICFQSPHFLHFRLKNALKVNAATQLSHYLRQPWDYLYFYSQNFIANTDTLKPWFYRVYSLKMAQTLCTK